MFRKRKGHILCLGLIDCVLYDLKLNPHYPTFYKIYQQVRNYQAGFFTELNVQDNDIDNEIGDLFGDIDQNESPPPILNNNGEVEAAAVNVVEEEEEEEDLDGQERRRSRKKGPSINNGSSSTAASNANSNTTIITDMINQLKVLGIPTSLCSLIHNMIDSIHGDLSGNEAYKSMADVQTDIQLLIDQPTKYLYDVNVEIGSDRITIGWI